MLDSLAVQRGVVSFRTDPTGCIRMSAEHLRISQSCVENLWDGAFIERPHGAPRGELCRLDNGRR